MTHLRGGQATGRTEYPALVVRHLAECKRLKATFDTAWRSAMDKYPPPENFTKHARFAETPLVFFKRQCRAAYDNVAAERYCADRACVNLAFDGMYCVDHAEAA